MYVENAPAICDGSTGNIHQENIPRRRTQEHGNCQGKIFAFI